VRHGEARARRDVKLRLASKRCACSSPSRRAAKSKGSVAETSIAVGSPVQSSRRSGRETSTGAETRTPGSAQTTRFSSSARRRAERLTLLSGSNVSMGPVHVRRLLLTAGLALALAGAALAARVDFADPLVPQQWWRAAVRVDGLRPPGPGVPVTIVDSGVRLDHPEFLGRPDLVALNAQEPAPIGGVHGTAVASVAAAPANGVGIVGLYPTAALRVYDVSLGDGTQLPPIEIARGILTAARAGRSVISLSVGTSVPDPRVEAAVAEAVRRGSLVVAASGNSGEGRNRLSYPGGSAHVLTVAATDRADGVLGFSTRSPYVDIAAPGVEIPVAQALGNGWETADGTSFAAPMVAAAAAWVWTLRPDLRADQVAEVLRRSARDVHAPGYDPETGFGILDVAVALSTPAPPADGPEPSDTVADAIALTARGRTSGAARGSVTAYEDPRDVLRVFVPAGRELRASATSAEGVALALHPAPLSPTTRLARGASGSSLAFRNGRVARTAYLVVTPAPGVRRAEYALTVRVR
jgi:hypothetical protein